jgi:hypothetical protein
VGNSANSELSKPSQEQPARSLAAFVELARLLARLAAREAAASALCCETSDPVPCDPEDHS